MLTIHQIDQFEQDGAVTIDTPLTEEELQRLRATYDQLFPTADSEEGRKQARHSRTANFFDQPIIDLIQHPFFEDVAAFVLRTPIIRFQNIGISKTYPRPNEEFSFTQHTDIQYSLNDLDATPRRMVLSFFVWLADVTEKRAPLMYRRGSHRQIAAWRQRDPSLLNQAPHVHGTTEENLPPLDYVAPTPIVARAGQATMLTTALVHGPSNNVDTRPRYACHLSYNSADLKIPLPEPGHSARLDYHRALRDHLRPSRVHLVS